MATIFKPPSKLYDLPYDQFCLFLAGSIEQDNATNWQQVVEDEFKNSDIIILNPRRDKWDSSLEQTIENQKFVEQIEWELEALENSNAIFMFFEPGTKSPISLLELGLFAKRNIVVCCPKGFWRKGNVDIVCKRYNIPVFETIIEAINLIKRKM